MSSEFLSPEQDVVPAAELPLHPYQEEMQAAIQDAYYGDTTRAYIDGATGCGKDFTIARAVKGFLDENPDLKMLYLCHNKFILGQAMDEIAAVTGSSDHGKMFGGAQEGHQPLLFGTFQTMRSTTGGRSEPLYKSYKPDEFDLVIVNESHHGPAPTYRPVVEYYEPQLLLGATATADRRDGQDPEELFGKPIYKLSLEEAIAKGYLARPDYHVLTDQVRQLDDFSGQLDSQTRKDIADFNGMVFVPKRDEEVVNTITEHLKDVEDPRTLIFCSSIAHTEHFSKLMPGESAALHSELSPDEQDKRLKDFRSGKVPTLLVVDMLNEGVDVPEINTVVFLRSTESKTVFFQQLGRGLRKIAGKDRVKILDFVANWDRLTTLENLQSGIRSHRRRTAGQQGPHQRREADAGDISFNFSPEAMEAVKIIEEARDRERRRGPKPLKPNKIAESAKELKAMLGGIDKLPPYRVREEEWQEFEQRLLAGDRQVVNDFMMRCLPQAYRRARDLAETTDSGEFTAEELFQTAIERLYDVAKTHHADRKTPFGTRVAQALHRLALGTVQQKAGGETPVSLEGLSSAVPDPAPGISMLEDSIERASKLRAIRKAADKQLADREIQGLELRYGLSSGQPLTLDETGRVMNVSGERIRQMENGALKKIRRSKDIANSHKTNRAQLYPKALKQRLARDSLHEAMSTARDPFWHRHEHEAHQSKKYHEALGTLAANELAQYGLYLPVSTGWLMQRVIEKYTGRLIHFASNDFTRGLHSLQRDGLASMSWRRDLADGSIYEYIQLVKPR